MDIVQQTLFAQDAVKMLHAIDFDLESDTKINITHRNCMLVLFYTDNQESKNLVTIWSVAAKQVVGPIFAACNLAVDRKVAEAFASLNMANGSLHWAALKTIPFVLVYQNGWPIAFYNGERAVQPIIDYSLTLACKADYHEPFNLFGGMQAQENLMIKGLTQYGIPQNPRKNESLQYVAGENIRGYDANDAPVLAGTPQAAAAAAHRRGAERAEGARVVLPISPLTGGVRVGQLPPPPAEEAPRL